MSEEKVVHKVCLRCTERLPITDFVFFPSSNGYNSYCSSCNTGRVKNWTQKNAVRVAEYNLKYNTSERGFIIRAFARIFKPSSSDTMSKNISLIKKTYTAVGHSPKLTKEELWAELFLYIQYMKNKFPGSDGRLCRYCLQPWTYTRSKPNALRLGTGNAHSGGRAPRTKTWTNFSVDRFDNNKSYEKGNIVFCCSKCNSVKSSSTKKMWLRFLEVDKELKEESLDNGR
jgi:hypothetical protein